MDIVLDSAYDVPDDKLSQIKDLPEIDAPYIRIYQKILFAIIRNYNIPREVLKEQIQDLISEIDTIIERLVIDEEH